MKKLKTEASMAADNEVSSDTNMSKAERLMVAGSVAPSLRSTVDKNQFRRVTVVDRNDPSKIVGYTTLSKVQEAALETAKIEIAVDDGVRPKKIICRQCGKLASVSPKGVIPTLCLKCFRPKCILCGSKLSCPSATRCLECTHIERAKSAPKCPKCGLRTNMWNTKGCSRCLQLKERLRCSVCNDVMSKVAGTPGAIARRNGAPPKCIACCRAPKLVVLCACGVTLGIAAMSPRTVAKRKGAPPQCNKCSRIARRKPRAKCASCGVELKAQATSAKVVAKRKEGIPPRCNNCARRKAEILLKVKDNLAGSVPPAP